MPFDGEQYAFDVKRETYTEISLTATTADRIVQRQDSVAVARLPRIYLSILLTFIFLVAQVAAMTPMRIY